MLSANKANESAWIVSLTSVSIISCAYKKNRDLELRYMFLGQIFAKNAKKEPKTLFEASKSVKKQTSENHGKVPK